MIEGKGEQLHSEGDGWITHFVKRMRQIEEKYLGEEAKRKGIGTTLKTKEELREQYLQENNAPTIQKTEERESVLDLLG